MAAVLAAAVIAAAAAAGYAYLAAKYEAPGPLESAAVVYLPPGTSLNGIAEILAEKGAIARPWLFVAGTEILDDDRALRAGEYEIPVQASMADIAALLKEGRTVVRKLTVAEGLTTKQVLALVAEAEGLTGPIGETPDEGRLLPETYFYSYGDSQDDMVRRMARNLDQTLAAAWANRAENLPYETPEEALILASIIEKETGKPAERAEVAAVFVNRLRKGMKLQADPTVIYALTRGQGGLDRPLTTEDLVIDSPYNTYAVTGLPPGPIANPGRDSIEAALRPADSDYLYFVSDGEGGHEFARTLAEHNRNVAKLRRQQREERRNGANAVNPAAGNGASPAP